MVGCDRKGLIRRLARVALRGALWGAGVALAVAAVYWPETPGLSVLGFFAVAFVCWDAGFLLRRGWLALRTPPEAELAAQGLPSVPDGDEAEPPIAPGSAWAVRDGAWVEVRLEPDPAAPLAQVLDVVIEPFDGRPVLCPLGEFPPVPLEFLGRHVILCRLQDGSVLRVQPLD